MITDILFTDSLNGFISLNPSFLQQSDAKILTTTDGGATWGIVHTGITAGMHRLSNINNQAAYAMGLPSGVLEITPASSHASGLWQASGGYSLRAYPNPAREFIRVTLSGTESPGSPVTIELCDVQGRTVIRQTVRTGIDFEINLKGCKPGIYIIRVIGPQGLARCRILVQ